MPSLHAVMDRFFRQPYATTTSTDSAARFATSWLFSPVVFTFWRAAISFYAFSVLFVSIALEATHGGDQLARRSFGYFTILGYWGLAFYFAVAAFHSGSVWRRGRARLESWPRWLRFAHSCFYSSVVVFPILVTIIFWTVLANGAFSTRFNTWTNISQHALNTVFAVSEIVLPRTAPLPWINISVLVALLGGYLILAETIHATQGWYPYDFLNTKFIGVGGVTGACFVCLVGTVIIFAVVHGLILLRQWVTEDKLHMSRRQPGEITSAERSVAQTVDSSFCVESGFSDCELVEVEVDSIGKMPEPIIMKPWSFEDAVSPGDVSPRGSAAGIESPGALSPMTMSPRTTLLFERQQSMIGSLRTGSHASESPGALSPTTMSPRTTRVFD